MEGAPNKRRRFLSDEDKQIKRAGVERRRDMPQQDSWVAPEASKKVKRVDMEWDTWIAPDLRDGEERREKEAMARLRAKRAAENERKRRSKRTPRYDSRNMDTWIASDSPSPSTPEKHEHREQRPSPGASSCRDSKQSQSVSPSKRRDDTIKAPEK